MAVSASQSAKVLFSSVFSWLGRVTLLSTAHPSKAPSPMETTVSGKLTVVSFPHCEKAYLPTLVTLRDSRSVSSSL